MYYKHLVTKTRVVFRTAGLTDVRYVRISKEHWLALGRPDRMEQQ